MIISILFFCLVRAQAARVIIPAGDCWYPDAYECEGNMMNISTWFESSNAIVSSAVTNSVDNCTTASVIYTYFRILPTMSFNNTLSGSVAAGIFCIAFCNEDQYDATELNYELNIDCLVSPPPKQPCNDSCDLGLTLAFGILFPSIIATIAIGIIIYTRCRKRDSEQIRLLSNRE